MKRAAILEEGQGQFALEYDNTVGRKNWMRLDASTYERAIREARAFLGINESDLDDAGDGWIVE